MSFFSGTGARARILLLAIALACVAIFLYLPSPVSSLAEIRAAKSAGETPDWKDKVDLGGSLASILNFILALALALTARLWAKPLQAPDQPAFPVAKKVARWFWPLVLAAVVLAAGLRVNLAKKSLWWDELWNVKQASHGQWRTGIKHPDELRFYPADWARCAFYYQKPTNHPAIALGSKASLTLWRTFTGAPQEEFSDFAVRLPALLAALLSIAMAAWIFRIWDLPGTGVLAAFLLALHPYHIRYGVDVRAYTLVVLATLLIIAGLSAALRRSKNSPSQSWLPWVVFGAGQFLLVWASVLAGTIFATCFFLVAAALVFAVWKSKAARITALSRLVVVNTFAAMAFLQVFTPNILQIEDALASENVTSPLNADRLKITASQFLLGLETTWGHEDDSAGLVSLADRGGWPTAAAVAAALSAGLFSLARRRRAAFWILSAAAAATAIYIAYSLATDFFYYHRFLIASFTAIVLAVAAGIVQLASIATRNSAARASLSVALLGLFTWAVYPQITLLNSRPYAPLRDVADYLRSQAGGDPDSITAIGYGLGGRIVQSYYPPIKWASADRAGIGLEGFEAEIKAAQDARRPLFVFVGYDAFNRFREPWGFHLLDDPNLFEHVATFRGIEPDFTFRILRLK